MAAVACCVSLPISIIRLQMNTAEEQRLIDVKSGGMLRKYVGRALEKNFG